MSQLDDRVVEMYRGVRDILSKYRSGKLPKAFKIIPSLSNWEQVEAQIKLIFYFQIIRITTTKKYYLRRSIFWDVENVKCVLNSIEMIEQQNVRRSSTYSKIVAMETDYKTVLKK